MSKESKLYYSSPELEMFSVSAGNLCEFSNGVKVDDFPGLGDEQDI